ncbi:MAG TPA: hypothetical protein VFW23_05225 [Tepidisphaeraceae bacterium]|nr:hypothetical protein [Tepidisphaeraceae bacterium]
MTRNAKNKKQRPRATQDILHSLRELASAIEAGVPLESFTVRTVSIPEPGKYARAAQKRLRGKPGFHRHG